MHLQLRWPVLAGTLQSPQKTGRGRRKPAQAVGQPQKLQNLNDEVLSTTTVIKEGRKPFFSSFSIPNQKPVILKPEKQRKTLKQKHLKAICTKVAITS